MGHRVYRFRIYPNTVQKEKLNQIFGCVRFTYNHFLSRRKEVYEIEKRSLTYQACAKELTALKKEKLCLKEVDSIALQQSLRHLEVAFQNFFRDKKVGYPRFKSKKRHRDSYTTVYVNNNIRLEHGNLLLPKIKQVKIKCHRGSRRYEKQRLRTARVHEKISAQRKDYLHKKSRQIANACDAVCVEDLNLKGMACGMHFGKSVHDNGWGMFLTFLSYKLEEQGKKLVKINRWYKKL